MSERGPIVRFLPLAFVIAAGVVMLMAELFVLPGLRAKNEVRRHVSDSIKIEVARGEAIKAKIDDFRKERSLLGQATAQMASLFPAETGASDLLRAANGLPVRCGLEVLKLDAGGVERREHETSLFPVTYEVRGELLSHLALLEKLVDGSPMAEVRSFDLRFEPATDSPRQSDSYAATVSVAFAFRAKN